MNNKHIAQVCIEAIKKGNKLLVCGNGGSAAQSQHFVAELVNKFKYNRCALPAISLTTDTSVITSIANDYGFENIFSRQIEAIGEVGDVLITISTSGKSENVLKAIETAKDKGMIVVQLNRGGDSTPQIQEYQLCDLHEIAGMIEEAFYESNSTSTN
jgi:D-sedoheptulose 7-phosphate isomerase